jgi:multidrug efflux system membrane fusion protein
MSQDRGYAQPLLMKLSGLPPRTTQNPQAEALDGDFAALSYYLPAISPLPAAYRWPCQHQMRILEQRITVLERHVTQVIVGVLGCFALTSCSRWTVSANTTKAESVPVRVAVAFSQDVPLEISAVGNVEPMETVAIKPRIAGQIKRVEFEEGQNVAQGQLLFTIDSDALETQAAEQQAEVDRDTALEQQARALLARDAAVEKQSHAEADTALELAKNGIVSKQHTDQLVTASETAQAALRSDQATLEAAGGTVNADSARLAQTLVQLGFTRITAPISGRAGAVMVKAGNVVRDNDTTLVTLLQLSPIYVVFGIPEQMLSEVQRLNADGPLMVEARDGDGAAFTGRLSFVDNAVDATTGTIKLKAVFSNDNGALWPGQFVSVRVCLRVEPGRTLVPASAVQDGLDGKYVWQVKSGVATIAPVTVLHSYKPEESTELAVLGSGIGPGDTVVTEGQLRLTPGVKVTTLATLGKQPPVSNTR